MKDKMLTFAVFFGGSICALVIGIILYLLVVMSKSGGVSINALFR